MSKRPGCELSNNSKRLKSDNVMQPLQNYISQNHKFNLKSQASVTDPKTNNLFESDSDDEEIWIHASQVEQRVLGTQKITNKQEIQIETNSDELDISYASFQTAEGITSTQQQLTQNIPIIDLTMTSERANKIDPKIQILQNKCAALEKQLKKYKPNYAELSQRTNEMSELKERIRKLTNENDELRNEKLKNEIETVGEKESQKLKSENEELKKMIEKLIKEKNSNSDEEVTNDQENLRQKLNGSFVKPLSYKEKISEMEKCSMSFISTRVQSQNASNSSEVFKKPFDVSQKSQKSNLTVKQQEHLAKSSSQHHKLNFQAQKSSNLTSQHSNLSQKSSHLISSSSQKSLTFKSSNLSQKSSNNIPRTQSSSQVINLEELDEIQQNSSYKSRKSSIWNETDEAEIFVASNDIEVFDLIKKTECFNIFDEKDSNFENFPTTNLKIIKIENCGENFISKSSSAPENKNIEKFKLQASKSLPNLKKYSSEPQNIYQNFTTFSPSQIDYKEIPKDSNEISNLKFLITKIDKIEISELFNEISKVFVKISSSIKEVEMRRFNEHFMKQEFAFKQAQHFSQQHFADREFKTISKCDIKSLVSHKKLFEDEKRIEERRLISLVSIICKNSQKLCEKILTQNISSFDDFQTIVDEICEIIDPYILQSRLLYENSGIAISLSELLCSFSSHYEKFEKSEIIDEKLMKFFNHVLSMSTNSPKTLNKLTKFLINISKNSEFEIIKKFCIDFPSGILEFSKIYKIYQIPRNGCLLQIFFCLLASTFRFVDKIEKHQVEDLIELTTNVNLFVDILMANWDKMEFLKPKENDESKNHCKCYKFLTIALLTLNEQVLRHKNYESDKNFYNLRKITKSAVINIANLLSLTRKTVGFWNFNFCHNMMDDVSLKIKFDKVAVGDEVFKYKDVMLPGKSHDTFLKKLKVKTTIQDDDLSFLNLSQQEIDLNNTIKERNENLRKNLINETVQFLKED